MIGKAAGAVTIAIEGDALGGATLVNTGAVTIAITGTGFADYLWFETTDGGETWTEIADGGESWTTVSKGNESWSEAA